MLSRILAEVGILGNGDTSVTIIDSGFGGKIAVYEDCTGDLDAAYLTEEDYIHLQGAVE
jgi:hypothetical protein